MKFGRPFVVLGALAVALSLTIGTGGFSAVEADRSVDVRVVDDEDAYLGVRTHDPTVTANRSGTVALVDLENRFGRELDFVDVDVSGDSRETKPDMKGTSAPDVLGSESVTASVHCVNSPDNPSSETWTVSITAAGPAAEISLDRTVTVTCENSPSWSPTTETAGETTPTP